MAVEQKPRAWLTATAEHEGYPIYFRRPDMRVTEASMLRASYPRLLVVTHQLTRVTGNGLPEAEYNASLTSLDSALVGPFRDETSGLVAIIETFAGKRTYYVYLCPRFNEQQFMDGVIARFPSEKLSWKLHDDPSWKLFNGYAADFGFA
ncbi:MAG: DUF695 domain-containing protein [Rhodanobacter sp.]